MEVWNETRLLGLLSNKDEESLTLEYKAAAALGNSDEIRKDVSAMANSAGGHIIYGMRETKQMGGKPSIPTEIEDVSPIGVTKEKLEHIIGNVQPKIPNVIIHSVSIPSKNGHLFVVEIPESDTAHMARNMYYRRGNFESRPMEDYEVRTTMNRARLPIIDIGLKFVSGIMSPNGIPVYRDILEVTIEHKSGPLARYVYVSLEFPMIWLDIGARRSDRRTLTWKNVEDKLFVPVWPQTNRIWRIQLRKGFHGEDHFGRMIHWQVWADNAAKREQKVIYETVAQNRYETTTDT